MSFLQIASYYGRLTIVRGCRVRICIFATTTWPDIYRLLTTTITICQKLKVSGVYPTSFDKSLLDRRVHCDDLVEQQSQAVNQQLLEYVDALRKIAPIRSDEIGSSAEVIEAANQGLQRYGIGPCSARWFYGSFDSFIQLEQRLANLYPSLLDLSGGNCRGESFSSSPLQFIGMVPGLITILILAMICGDGEITLGRTLTPLAIPTSNPKKKHNQVFIYKSAPKGILDGAKMARDTQAVVRNYYEHVDDIPSMLECDKPTHLTFYFLTCNPDGGQILDLPALFSNPKFRLGRTSSNIKGITIMLDDRNGLGRIGPHKLGYLDHMENLHHQSFLSETFGKLRGGDVEVRCIVAGSWYDSFGHQGGYVTGHKDTVEALTWDAKAYFFSTPPMPLQAQMTDKAIEILEKKRDQAYVN